MKHAITILALFATASAFGQTSARHESKMFVYFNQDSSSIYVSRIDYIEGQLEKAEMRCDLNKAPYEESCKLYHNGKVVGVYPHDHYEIELARLSTGKEERIQLPNKH